MLKRVSLLTGLVIAALLPATGGRSYQFASRSVLATGKWVKVETAKSGIHEISYDRLREMGFSNPSAVSVYGEGGKARPVNLMTDSGRTQTDDPMQVPVLHKDNKLYFYAISVNEPDIQALDYEAGTMNIYNTRGHYLLTDSGTPLLMNQTGSPADNAMDRSVGLGFVMHETDLVFGAHNTGQHFWEFNLWDNPDVSWSVKPSYPADNATANVNMKLMVTCTYPNSTTEGNISVILNDTSRKWFMGREAVMNYWNYKVSDIPFSESTVPISLKIDEPWIDDAWLDNWIFTYTKDMSKAGSEMRQERLGLTPNAEYIDVPGYVTVPDATIAFDVTDPMKPTVMNISGNKAWIANPHQKHQMVFVNEGKSQYSVMNPVAIPNTNIHALKYEPYEFIIYTVPEYRKQAEDIAALHLRYDGTNVLVLDINDVYNEFTSGNADPMALRLCTKMFYENGGKELKNVLLFGPIRSDARNILKHGLPDNFIIGYQEGVLTSLRELAIALDFYGYTDDNVGTTTLHQGIMDVGVGVLPINNINEADLAVTKIDSYLNHLGSSDMAHIVNETMTLSCTGDLHTHDNAALSLGNSFQEYARDAKAGKLPHSTIMYDFYTDPGANQAFKDKMNNGKLVSIYVGHSDPGGLGGYIFTGDLMDLRNPVPGFIFFAGCDIAKPDFGAGGIGHDAVVKAPRGFIGSVCSTRTAYSNANLELCRLFTRNIYHPDGTSAIVRNQPATIGEIYARAKTELSDINELPYIYIGDPALKVPVTLLEVRSSALSKSSYRGGDILEISGTIRDSRGYLYSSYNGSIVMKVCRPTQQRSQITFPDYRVSFYDDKLVTVSAKVRSGKFTVKVALPKECDEYLSYPGSSPTKLNVYLSSYNPFSHLAGGGFVEVPLAYNDNTTAPVADTSAPEVVMEYVDDTREIQLEITDDIAVQPGIGAASAITMTIDGIPVSVPADSRAGTPAYYVSVPVDKYTPGPHTAIVTATDMAGNTSKAAKLDFNVTADGPAIYLTADRIYAVDNINFTLNADKSLYALELVITGPDGNVAHTEYVNNGSITWNCKGMPAGSYRAAVRSSINGRSASRWLDFSIID